MSELGEYFNTKPFVNDPICLWLLFGCFAPTEGSDHSGGSVPACALQSRS